MAAEGVVDALKLVHRWLRPDGVLLDLHPEPAPLTVEVQVGPGPPRHAGILAERGVIPRIHTTRATLARLIGEGLYRHEQAITFDFLYHCVSFDDWRACMAGSFPSQPLDDADIARVRDRLPPAGGEIVVRERIYAARLRRGPA